MAIKVVETWTHVLPPVLRFATPGVQHEYGRVYNYNLFLSLFYRYNIIFLVKCISRTCVIIEEMFLFRFFPHWVCSEELLRLATPRLRISCLALTPALVWTDPSSCVMMYFIIKYVSIKHNCKNCISVWISHFISTWMMLQ